MNCKEAKFFIVLIAFLYSSIASAQGNFRGSFIMSFPSGLGSSNSKDAPMLWNIDSSKMIMEVQDEMKKKGVSKRVLFNIKDSTWTMIMQFNKVNQATRMRASAMFHDSIIKPKIKLTSEWKKISGYNCRKTIFESKDYNAEVWVCNELKFNLCKIYKMLSHCGMMNEFTRKGDWFYWKNPKGMIMEVTSTKKSTGESYTMAISEVAPGEINYALFDLKGFKISEIPEGQSCGPTVNEK